MKKLYIILLTLLPLMAAARAFTTGGLVFRCYSDEGGIVVDMEDDNLVDSLVVPETVYDPTEGETFTVTTIDENALQWGQYSVVTLPKTIVRLGEDAFSTCDRLTHIYCFATTPPSVHSDGAFDDNHFEQATLHVPEEAIAAYREANEWKRFKHIVAIDTKLMGMTTVTEPAATDSPYYDLQGRRMAKPALRKGIYLHNGKKTVIK